MTTSVKFLTTPSTVRKTMVLLLLALFSPSLRAHDETTLWRDHAGAVREEIVARGWKSTNKQANNPGTPTYFLSIERAQLQRNIRSLDWYRSSYIYSSAWSGFYWPNYLGGVAYRRADRYYPRNNWGKSRDYVLRKPSHTVATNTLSPAEKYDIVMGVVPEIEGSLTSTQWSLGKAEYETTGRVATWQGICNGWAAASISLPMPRRVVPVATASRGSINFSTDDVMALGSLLWAKGKFTSAYAGHRCDTPTPMRGFADPDPERPERNQHCFDINPADWHLITLHMVGMRRKPFIIDYVNTSEVWNKPVIGYTFTYIDMLDRRRESSYYEDVRRTSAQISFNRPHRALYVKYVVGVKMNVTLLFGATSEDNGDQETRVVEYKYMLELDKDENIIGGEWISKDHPDFAWVPLSSVLPTSEGDAMVTGLDPARAGTTPAWTAAANAASAHGSPLPAFVQWLYTRAAHSP